MFDYNEIVEIVWQGTNLLSPENHAMHLHGYSFFVVGVGLGNFNHVTDPQSYNLIDPPEVNTIGLPTNGWLALRFVANNPGKFLYMIIIYNETKPRLPQKNN